MKPSGDQLRHLAREAKNRNGPSDVTQPEECVLAGWLAAVEAICAAIKAEDDYCVTQGDYMLDANDCIKVARGEWERPDYSVNGSRK